MVCTGLHSSPQFSVAYNSTFVANTLDMYISYFYFFYTYITHTQNTLYKLHQIHTYQQFNLGVTLELKNKNLEHKIV